MIFTTPWFVIFAGLVTALFWIVPRGSPRLIFLAAVCTWFHFHFAGPAGVAPILVMMLVTYLAGLSRQRSVLVAAIVVNVGALVFYKYINFLVGAALTPINPEWATAIQTRAGAMLPEAPPLAVSFFTFEFVHYLYEVKHGGPTLKNPVKFILFSVFFPSLVAGPIKRYTHFIPELDAAVERKPQWDDFSEGARRLALGFAKKVLLADTLTLWIDQTYPNMETIDPVQRIYFVGALGLRILFDFSGYTDMAIGCSRLIGIRLPENFNWPYLATNLQEFWQRWHMSLSSWIRDYVYIPLGGNRCGWARQAFNATLAFALCGLWHGPAWNFIVWGLYHGLGLVIVVFYKRIPGMGGALHSLFAAVPPLGFVLTQVYVFLGWLLFFYPLADALRLAKLVLGLS